MAENIIQEFYLLVRGLTENGKSVLAVVLLAALAGITVLGALHDVSSQAVVAVYSAIIGASVGHIGGQRQGRLEAENEHLTKASSARKVGRK